MPSPSVHLSSSDSDSDESDSRSKPPVMYADLVPFLPDIRFRMDEKQNFWWAEYDKMKSKDIKTLLRGRGQAVYGNKNALIARLVAGDR